MKNKLLKNWKVDIVLLMLFMLVIVSFLHTDLNLVGFAILDFNGTNLTVENETFSNETFDNVTEINISGLAEDFLIQEISGHKKKITINSVEALVLVGIKESPADAITVYKYENNNKVVFEDVDFIDSNGDGQIDKLKWTGFEDEVFEVVITILNVQSYPTVGGNWTVQFETKGEADLVITTFNQTTWSNENELEDLRFLEIKCGDDILDYSWINDSVVIYNYACEEIGFEVSKVLTSGVHDLEFTFGSQTAYAHNLACGSTITKDTTLDGNMDCSGTAITIGADNIILDCAGYNIIYATSGTAGTYAVDNSGNYDSVTIKNCNIIEGESGTSSKYGIDLGDTVNSIVMNNTITTIAATSHGIFFDVSSSFNRVLNNTITTSGGTAYGVNLRTSNSNITGNIIHTNGSSSQGISITSSNTICFNNTITTEGTGAWAIRVFGSSNNNVFKNTINTTGTDADAIYVAGNSDGNVIYENTIIASGGDGIELRKVFASSPNNNNISKNVFDNVDDYDIRVGEATDVTYLIDQAITNYSFFSGGNIISFRNSSVGEIRYLSGVNGTGLNLSENIQMSTNYIYVNSSKQGLNRSANLTFWGVSDITNPIPLRDGVVCSSSICSNVTNSTTTTFHFNVSGFTYYSVRNETTTPPITNLTSPADGYYTTSPRITFTCNATSDAGLDNITLYHNISGSWVANQTVDASGASKVTSFSVSNIPNGFYSWNCLAYDGDGRFDWADSNWTFIVNNSYRAYEKLGIPTNPGDYDNESLESDYNNMNASNDNRWTTALADTDGQYDSQVFIFNITDDVSEVSNVSLLNFTWEGYGEDTADYYTNISYFNWSSSAWVEVTNKDFISSADDTLAGFVNSNVSDFVNSSTNEVAVLVTTRKHVAFSGWCYQETANASHASDGGCTLNYSGNYSCSGNWDATYTCANTYDENWNTYGYSGSSGYLYINYTKPTGALNTSLWKISGELDGGDNTRNNSIPTSCWDYYPNKLSFKVKSYEHFEGATSNYWYCYNGSWKQVDSGGYYSDGYNKVYEEGMWWNISSSPFLYTYQNEKYTFLSDFIAGAIAKEKEYTSFTDITKTEITNNKVKLKITEELDETTYLDRIYLLVDEKEIIELSSITNADNDLLKESDDDYLIMEQGNEYYLEFQAPKNYEKLEFAAEGYYIEHYKKKDSEDPHNSLNTDFVSLVVTEYNNAPSLTLDHPQNITYYINTSISLNYTATDDTGLDTVWYNLDGGSNTTLTANITFATSDGSHKLNIWANDTLNNINDTSVDFYVNAGCNATLTSSYTMSDDLTCIGTAFHIGANNVTLDCSGHTITYGTAGASQTRGVDNSGNYDNITIRDCIIVEGISTGNNKDAIFLADAINSTVHNNTLITIGSASSNGIVTTSSAAHNNLTNNTITTSGASGSGIVIASSNSNVFGNIIHTNDTTAIGIDLGAASNSVVMSNNIITEGASSAFGIRLAGSSNINVSLNEINVTGASSNAIQLATNSDNNVIHKNNIIHCDEDAIKIVKFFANIPNNNNLSGNTFGDVAGYDINIGADTDTTYLIDQSATNYSIDGTKVNFKNSTVGEIKYLEAITSSGISLSTDIVINYNYSYVDSSKAGLNKTADIILNNVLGIVNPIPMRDGVNCPPSICSVVTNISNNYYFNVTGFSYYSVVKNNTAPPQVTLSSPESQSLTNDRTPILTWNAAVDADGDSVTYEINVDNDDDFESCAINESSISDVTYTPGSDLGVDDIYYWRVKAFDGEDYGQWSDVWSFNITSLLAISLTNNEIDFGDVDRGTTYDTSDDNPIPFSVQNDGNVLVNISVNSSSLFSSVSMPDSSYRAKADGIIQSGQSPSFDYSRSNTEWFDMPESDLIMVIASLKYADATDDGELDILIIPPMDELEGSKSSTVLFLGDAEE